MSTKIEWVRNLDGSQGSTVNPIRFRNLATGKIGHHCTKISPGCKNCYASTMNGGPYLSGLTYIAENTPKGEFFLDENVLQQVLWRQKPTTYFWCDMTDLFGEWVPDEWIDRCAAVCALTPQHRHLWLTKRAKRMREYVSDTAMHRCGLGRDVIMRIADRLNKPPVEIRRNWPLPNLGLGVSAEDQEHAYERWEHLKATLAAMRFMSGEPLLGAIDLDSEKRDGLHALGCGNEPDCGCGTTRLDWVILGGESGPGARPCRIEWIESVIEQCRAAGTPCFVKQLGAKPIWAGAKAIPVSHGLGKNNNAAEWPESLRVQELPEFLTNATR